MVRIYERPSAATASSSDAGLATHDLRPANRSDLPTGAAHLPLALDLGKGAIKGIERKGHLFLNTFGLGRV